MKLNPKFSDEADPETRWVPRLSGKVWEAVLAAKTKFPGLRIRMYGEGVVFVTPDGVSDQDVLNFIKSHL